MSTVPNDPADSNGMANGEGEREHPATDEIAQEAHEAVDEARERAEDLEQVLRKTAGDAAERLRETERRLEAPVAENIEKVKAFVKNNPLASAGIAFVAGLVVSNLIRR
ncbi:MAG TPA: DUF883 domain-containing protein [Gammaproteobacteria bacterium]|nr:DUF883 domain-containing protein [Gammaproteobacteria bacterium]